MQPMWVSALFRAQQLRAAGVYARLLAYVRPYRRAAAGAVAAMIVQAGADALVPVVMSDVVAQLEAPSRGGGAGYLAMLIVLLFPIRGAMDFAAVYAVTWVGRSVVRDLRATLFERYLSLPARYLDEHPSGMLLSKLTYDTEQVAEGTSSAMIVLIRDSLAVVILVGVMIHFSPGLTLVTGIVALAVGWCVTYAGKALRRYSSRIQISMGRFTGAVQEMLNGHRIVKVFGAQGRVQQEFDKLNARNARLHLRLAAARALGVAMTQLIVALGVAVVIFAVLSGMALRDLDAAVFIGFISAMGMTLAPLRRLANVNATVQRAIAAAESAFAILDQPEEQEIGSDSLDRAEGHVEYRNVSFSYGRGGRCVLENVSIDIPAGKHVAFVGPSGSGKSTLVGLLARFYDLDAGSILLDGNDIHRYRLRDLRRQLSLVGQDVVLFDGSIADNIAYGALASSPRGEIERAAEAAQVMEFAAALPHGLDTRVGERGALLSGGQRQRIAIARALLKNAPILILDEATSALDLESERRIQAALRELMRGRTTLIIAHRLSAVESADRIVVLNDGAIVETGTHRELLALNGCYAALHAKRGREEKLAV